MIHSAPFTLLHTGTLPPFRFNNIHCSNGATFRTTWTSARHRIDFLCRASRTPTSWSTTWCRPNTSVRSLFILERVLTHAGLSLDVEHARLHHRVSGNRQGRRGGEVDAVGDAELPVLGRRPRQRDQCRHIPWGQLSHPASDILTHAYSFATGREILQHRRRRRERNIPVVRSGRWIFFKWMIEVIHFYHEGPSRRTYE